MSSLIPRMTQPFIDECHDVLQDHPLWVRKETMAVNRLFLWGRSTGVLALHMPTG
jgi:hypothetical protein